MPIVSKTQALNKDGALKTGYYYKVDARGRGMYFMKGCKEWNEPKPKRAPVRKPRQKSTPYASEYAAFKPKPKASRKPRAKKTTKPKASRKPRAKKTTKPKAPRKSRAKK